MAGGPSGRLPYLGGFWRFRSTKPFDNTVQPDVLDTGDVDADAALHLDTATDDIQLIDAAIVAAGVLDTDAATDDTPAEDAAPGDDTPADVAVAVAADQPDPDAGSEASEDANLDSQGEALPGEDVALDTIEAASDEASPDEATADAADAQTDDLSAIDLEYPELELLVDLEVDLWFDTALLEDPPAPVVDDQEYQAVTHEEAQLDLPADVADLLEVPDDAPVIVATSGRRKGGGGRRHLVHRRTSIIVQKIIRAVVEQSPEPVTPAEVRREVKKLLRNKDVSRKIAVIAPPAAPKLAELAHVAAVELPLPASAKPADSIDEDEEEALIALILELL